MKRIAVFLGLVGILLSACRGLTPGTPVPTAIQSPAPGAAEAAGQAPAELPYACGEGHPFAPSLLSEPARAEEGDDQLAAALRDLLASGNLDAEFLPESGWLLAGVDDTHASFIGQTGGDPPFVEAEFERHGDEWTVVGWGQCRPQIWLEGSNASTWTFDPAMGSPGPADRDFVALVTEAACASGQSSNGRVKAPLVVYGPDEVIIAFPVEPLGGAQECPTHPPSRVRVTLDEPIGDRALLDGGVFPYHDPSEAWPPA